MFQEISGDRSAELIGKTCTALFGDQTSTEPTATTSGTGTTAAITATTTETRTTATTTTIASSSADILRWIVNKLYHVGDRVPYQNQIYQCFQLHTSLASQDPCSRYSCNLATR